MFAQIEQRDLVTEVVDDEIAGRLRDQDLAAVGDHAQPRRSNDRLARIVAVARRAGLPRMDRHSHPQRRRGRPTLRRQRSLCFDCRQHRIRRAERTRPRSSRPRPAQADARHHGLTPPRPVRVVSPHRHRHRVGFGLPLARRRLDIGQQERHGAGWEHEATRTRRARHRRVSPTDDEPHTRLANNVIIHARTITRSALRYIADMGDPRRVMVGGLLRNAPTQHIAGDGSRSSSHITRRTRTKARPTPAVERTHPLGSPVSVMFAGWSGRTLTVT